VNFVFTWMFHCLISILHNLNDLDVYMEFHVSNVDVIQFLFQSNHIFNFKEPHKSKSSSPSIETVRYENFLYPYPSLKNFKHIMLPCVLEKFEKKNVNWLFWYVDLLQCSSLNPTFPDASLSFLRNLHTYML